MTSSIPSSTEQRDISFVAANIVHQIGDVLYEELPPDVAHEHFVTARQNTNDIAIDFAEKLIRKTLTTHNKALVERVEGMRPHHECLCGSFLPKSETGYHKCGVFIGNTPSESEGITGFCAALDQVIAEINK